MFRNDRILETTRQLDWNVRREAFGLTTGAGAGCACHCFIRRGTWVSESLSVDEEREKR